MKQRIGKFEILREIGHGAMGEVFLARDPVIGREVAIKTLHPTWAATPQARERFFREAQAAGRLSHPNIVTVLEFGEEDGRLYLVMEYVPGEDLAAALAERSLPPAVILELLAEVCDGLALAHRNGILHRDIKPSNIRLQAEGASLRAKILDFGIARTQSSDLTTSSTLLGTFSYMAPEYIQSGLPDPQSDLFAVAVILYEALAGRRPFRADSTANLFYRILNESPKPPPAAHLRGVSPATLALLQRALAKDPRRRFESAEALAAALRAAQDPEWLGPAPPTGTVPRRRPAAIWVQPTPLRVALALGALAVLVMAGFTLGRRARHVEAPVESAARQMELAGTTTPVQQAPVVTAPNPDQQAQAGAAPAPVRPAPPAAAPPPAEHAVARPDRPAPLPERPPFSLEAVAQLVDHDPAAALALLDGNPSPGEEHRRAVALRIVALYDLEKYRECADQLRGVDDLPRLARDSPRLARVLDRERREHNLPIDLQLGPARF